MAMAKDPDFMSNQEETSSLSISSRPSIPANVFGYFVPGLPILGMVRLFARIESPGIEGE